MKYGSFHFLSILQEPAPPCPELDLTFSEAFSKCNTAPHKELHISYMCIANNFRKNYSGNTILFYVITVSSIRTLFCSFVWNFPERVCALPRKYPNSHIQYWGLGEKLIRHPRKGKEGGGKGGMEGVLGHMKRVRCFLSPPAKCFGSTSSNKSSKQIIPHPLIA